MREKWDFCGWATKIDVKCSDGRTIRRGAFKNDDGKKVPLLYMHDHNDIENVLGHAILEDRDEGTFAYGYFNQTPKANYAREQLRNGDLDSLSIWANRLTQQNGDVLHGSIKEVSLVLAGANPEAVIEYPVIQHDDGSFEEVEYECNMRFGEPILMHAEERPSARKSDETGEGAKEPPKDKKTIGDIYDTFTDEEKKVTEFLVTLAMNGELDADTDTDKAEPVPHADVPNNGERTIADVIDGMSEEKQNALGYILDKAAKEKPEVDDDEVEHYNDEGEAFMPYNVFEAQEDVINRDTLSHDEMRTIINDGKRYGSLKESVIAHSEDYGIENIDYLFPEARNLNNEPEFIKRDTDWVSKVMSGVHHTPFSRVRSTFANITADEARAKGYIKGRMKKEEVFPLLKRVTTPTTVYKKQKLDKDDIRDITDFNVVAWLKTEMRMMLDEELARAILLSDGRSAIDEDKIDETHIRPIANDADLYTIKVNPSATATDASAVAKTFVDDVVIGMDDFKGTGEPTAFIRQDLFTRLMLLKDGQGYRLYKSVNELATAMMVKEIVKVPNDVMKETYAVIVNLADYNVGADKGGSVDMFEDFDIDYNQEKYLIETRCSGALVKPYSAIVVKPTE